MIGANQRVSFVELKQFCEAKHVGKRVLDVLRSLLLLGMIDMEVDNGADNRSFKP